MAVVTNISSDHFGEYGIDDLAGLADVKLSVAAVIAARGRLVLNADDALLRMKARELALRYGLVAKPAWFARDAEQSYLRKYRAQGASTCGVQGGRLWLHDAGLDQDLGLVSDDAALDRRHGRLQCRQSRRGRAGGGLAGDSGAHHRGGVRALR